MPVLRLIRDRFAAERPLAGLRVAACLHITAETANLMLCLRDGGAEVALCASNPLSTQDDVVEELRAGGVTTHGRRGVETEEYYRDVDRALDVRPHVTLDDGADLTAVVHTKRRELLGEVIGGAEETTTGVLRLRAMEADGTLAYPVVAVNDAQTKHMFDNRYGTGQSALDGVIRATNRLIAGSVVVVSGYGWVGRGIALRARGLGARVIVVEPDPMRALEAVMEGYEVTSMDRAAAEGDIFITATGGLRAIGGRHLGALKDGALLSNAGHFNVEIDLPALRELAGEPRRVRRDVEEYRLPGGRRVFVIGEGRLVNLAAAEGHPPEVMDMSFANQALCVEWLGRRPALERRVYPVPEGMDREVARLKLAAMGVALERLDEEQQRYLTSWKLGTE